MRRIGCKAGCCCTTYKVSWNLCMCPQRRNCPQIQMLLHKLQLHALTQF